MKKTRVLATFVVGLLTAVPLIYIIAYQLTHPELTHTQAFLKLWPWELWAIAAGFISGALIARAR